MEHTKKTNSDGEPVECQSCHYPGRVATYRDCWVSEKYHNGASKKDITLCEVCANTHISTQFKYPEQCQDGDLHRSLAVIGNMILDAIRDTETSKTKTETTDTTKGANQ